ncbi:hypothetical protein OY671_008586, partial [Metschnikowia pulcherrima]
VGVAQGSASASSGPSITAGVGGTILGNAVAASMAVGGTALTLALYRSLGHSDNRSAEVQWDDRRKARLDDRRHDIPAMQLVIVESPAKAKTIEKYLGPGYKVLASYGHVRDSPVKDGSVRPDEDFVMDWELYGDKQSRVKAITDAAKEADRSILATDPDREGEAISWHVRESSSKRRASPKEVERVTFNAITKATVTEAMQHPRALDQDSIDAYSARRASDYSFGFTLSPVSWRKSPGA